MLVGGEKGGRRRGSGERGEKHTISTYKYCTSQSLICNDTITGIPIVGVAFILN